MVQEKQMPPAVPLVFLLDSLYHDWLSSSFLYAANAFGIGYFSFNSPLSANSIPGISSPAFTRYPLICHSTWLKMCFASGSFSSTDAPPPRRSSTSFSESFPSRFGNSYRDASSPVSSRFLMAISFSFSVPSPGSQRSGFFFSPRIPYRMDMEDRREGHHWGRRRWLRSR